MKLKLDKLKTVLDGKTLEDLKPAPKEKKNNSNLLEPTQAEIEQMIEMFKQDKSMLEIRKTVRRAGPNGEDFGFHPIQIKAIRKEWEKKIKELSD